MNMNLSFTGTQQKPKLFTGFKINIYSCTTNKMSRHYRVVILYQPTVHSQRQNVSASCFYPVKAPHALLVAQGLLVLQMEAHNHSG